jgi:hypothetical protein
MIGLFAGHAGAFALGFAGFSSLVFALPFVVAPAGWGRAMRWTVPRERDLMAYYARCLGLLALSFNAATCWVVLSRPMLLPGFFAVLTLFSATMVPLHVYGWARGQQPWTETAEIPAWALVTLACLLFFPLPA